MSKKVNFKVVVGERNIVFSLLGVIGRASDNHVTVGHVTFREASSTIFFFLVADPSRIGPLSFVSIFSSSMCMQIILCEPSPYTRKKCKFLTAAIQHSLFRRTTFVTLFMVYISSHVL